MKIGAREIGPGHPPYIVGEMSGEHLGRMPAAFALIGAAKDAGADAVKAQLYDPIRLAEARGGRNKEAPAPWHDLTLERLYTRAHTPRHWFPELFDYAAGVGITLFSSVFDEEGVDFLEELDCPAYKISSFDLTNLPLIRKAASTGKPVIISEGMASYDEIRDAHRAVVEVDGNIDLAWLYCVSAYPARIEDMCLKHGLEHVTEDGTAILPQHRCTEGIIIGISDHTVGTTAAIVATALGASILEKHITLDRNNNGPDAAFSLEPSEFKKFCQDIKDAYASLGNGERPQSEIYHSLRVKRA